MNRYTRLLKKCWFFLAVFIIVLAIVFSVFRALTPWAKQYKSEVERHLTLLVGQPVAIKSMETSWYWLQPVLKLDQVSVLDHSDHVLKLAKLMVGINLLSSLWHWQLQPGILYVEDVHLKLRQINDQWQIDGLQQNQTITTLDTTAYLPMLGWLLNQQKIVLKNISALIYLKDGSLLPVSHLNLTAVNHHGHYRLKGEAKLSQTTQTSLLVLADVNLEPLAWQKLSGRAYFSVHQFSPTQWQHFFPFSMYQVKGGNADFDVWVDIVNGQLSDVQTQFNLNNIIWNKVGGPQNQIMQALKANLAWQSKPMGWQLSADKIKLRLGGVAWPENSLQINYQKASKTYRLFVEALLLEPLLTADINWPEIMQPILNFHPYGRLYDTQIGIKDGHLDSVLSRFSDLGWQQQDEIPAVNDLKGVISWQPTAGRLELDGENTSLTWAKHSPISFSQINAALEWKELSHGLRLSLERLVLNHPDLVLTARGALDEALSPDNRNLRLTAEFSADHAVKWLTYLPSKYIKPSLAQWLKNDIKRIDKVSGQMTIDGPLVDFPFDQCPGEFKIVSQLSGVDLMFDKNWPPINNIDADFFIDKRTLNVEAMHASLLGIETNQVNLYLDNIGLGKETLLVRGLADVPATELKKYVFASPLGHHFTKLKRLKIKGPAKLELNLEVPLYPENDNILAQGAIHFKNNQVIFHHELKDIQLNHVSGALAFDELGVTDSQLNAKLLGDPVAMYVHSVRKPQPFTEVRVEGDASIDLLRDQFDLPFLSFMEGHLYVTSKMVITDEPNDVDKLHISTSLEGVDINLPPPLGKLAKERVPLTIDVDFSNKSLAFRMNYANRLKVEAAHLDQKGWSYKFNQANIAGNLLYEPTANTLTGRFTRLFLPKSIEFKRDDSATLKPLDIPNLDFNIDAIKFGDIDIGQMKLKSTSTATAWNLDDFKIKSVNYLLTAKGSWIASAEKNNTTLQANLQVEHLEKALENWQITPALEAHEGTLQFNGGWQGGINNYSLINVNGNVSMNFQNGRITNLSHETEEKLGLGKLLSILSLQTIPRRLKLDFSDLSHNGYSYDTLKGNFVLKRGVLKTSDSYIDGPVAYANMKGNLDVIKHLYDVELHISPHITASLPIVATIAGGPIAGVATWVASKIINKGMQQVTGYTYKISGPWMNPIVQQVKIYKKKMDI